MDVVLIASLGLICFVSFCNQRAALTELHRWLAKGNSKMPLRLFETLIEFMSAKIEIKPVENKAPDYAHY